MKEIERAHFQSPFSSSLTAYKTIIIPYNPYKPKDIPHEPVEQIERRLIPILAPRSAAPPRASARTAPTAPTAHPGRAIASVGLPVDEGWGWVHTGCWGLMLIDWLLIGCWLVIDGYPMVIEWWLMFVATSAEKLRAQPNVCCSNQQSCHGQIAGDKINQI